jgi:N-acetyl-anhydromuramyl-L-alanine amidase AmpD
MIKRKETNRVVFHHSLSDFGDVDEIRRWHIERGFSDIGYHFVIPKEGHFQAGRKITLVGSHARGMNIDSIGICIIGDLSKTEITDSQLSEAAKLYHDICRAYSRKLPIEFHHELCPGKTLDREAFAKTLYESI